MNKINRLFLVLSLLIVAIGIATTAAYEPIFRIDMSNSTVTTMDLTISQWDEGSSNWVVPSDSIYFVDDPVKINVRASGGGDAIENADVTIDGHSTNYEGNTNATGDLMYTFSGPEITEGGQIIRVKVYNESYQVAQEDIYISYRGILSIAQTDTYTYTYIGGTPTRVTYIELDITPTIIDTKNGDIPVENANVTVYISNVAPGTTVATWTGGGGPASIPQSRFTNSSGKVTFGVRMDRSASSDKSSMTSYTSVEKKGYAQIHAETISDVSSNEACFIATATYGSPANKNLDTLRSFRDTILESNPVSTALVRAYYRTSPPVAYVLSHNDHLRTATRVFLISPSVLFAKFWLNPITSIGSILGVSLALFFFEDHRRSILKGLGLGAFTLLSFSAVIFTLGYLGYESMIFAVFGACLLPFMVPSTLIVSFFGGFKGIFDTMRATTD
ncbi:MAG: CFI-box-CTERM domain-containing protein [Halobacteriota archaeon]|nr:CFI-box-CTERM domain-containing protein [Halobacteriota archaeon]